MKFVVKYKRHILLSAIAIAIVAAAIIAWNVLASHTKIAFVNYQIITLGQISKANDNSSIDICELSVDELDKLDRYDMVFINGMGLRITEEQRDILTRKAEKGVPVMTTAATNPENNITSLDSVDVEYLKIYLEGGRNNYRNMLNYVRKFIDGKKLFAPMPGDPESPASSLLYYPDDKRELNFNSIADYETFLRREGKWNEKSPRVILTGQMGVPDSLVVALERSGNMVYPVNTLQKVIASGQIDSIIPSAIINMAHGRLGDNVVEWLKEKIIPLFSPVNANADYDTWMDDNMGMTGGFLSQSVVTPEIDGSIRPFTLFAQFKDKDGLPYIDVIPGRLDEFVSTVNNYITLQRKANKDKKIAIYYFKGPGQNSLVAEGMDVVPSLYNLLKRLQVEGYQVKNLPADVKAFEAQIAREGRVFGAYAHGASADFVRECHPEIITRQDYDRWCGEALGEGLRQQIDSIDGTFPGKGLSDGKGNVAIARLDFGNVVLIPQTAAGYGDDDFKIVHGTNSAPPHSYVASYLWTRYGFGADALIHFGAHGSLEFTPRKQVALSSRDWPDRLVGTLPHVYVYATSNVGEAMTAKRRSYAGIISYLTPPFMESNLRGVYKQLTDALTAYNRAANADNPDRQAVATASKLVKRLTIQLGIHRELRLDSLMTSEYSADDIARIESFADELVNEKVTGALYVMGVPYAAQYVNSTIEAMTIDPIAYSLSRLDGGKSHISIYRERAKALVSRGATIDDAAVCRIAGITQAELDSARTIRSAISDSHDRLSRMMVMGSMMPAEHHHLKISERKAPKKKHKMLSGMDPEKAIAMARKMGASEEDIKKMRAAMSRGKAKPGHGTGMQHGHGKAKEYSKQEIEFAQSICELDDALKNVNKYREELINSPVAELDAVVNALSGRYIEPTPGGDPVLNPNILPTGRNMFAINAEETPSVIAWENGKDLANKTIAAYRKSHNDSIPRKVSYTLWSSEFIETEGATIAQILYMLGIEPVRDPFGRVTDLRLIPSAELGRSRIDVVVQTSGQLRDLAASRLFLVSRAVKMAAEADDDKYPNYVKEGVVESEKHLVSKGVTPKEARELSTARVFGGVNGNYGTGIQEMVEAGDRWESDSEIADTYLNNMGALYGDEKDWEKVRAFAFEAALTRTDVVVQPRQSNTWGALSLDHVYEFMGGMNLAVRHVTGKDPEAYLSDYRNRNNVRMQEVKEAIGVESRTTILNPSYIQEKMKGGAGDASSIADVVRNTYGWNVMKPNVIDNALWDDIYKTYIDDQYGLGVKEFFCDKNQAALQEVTAVMMETARKGMWKATPEQLAKLAELHTQLVNQYGAACSGFVCDNAKLRDFIASNVKETEARAYVNKVAQVRAEDVAKEGDGMVMKREEMNRTDTSVARINGIVVAGIVVAALLLIAVLIIVRRRRR
ncbi:MAG: cobaltochelatase subunit CobN [Lepagella sp.]